MESIYKHKVFIGVTDDIHGYTKYLANIHLKIGHMYEVKDIDGCCLYEVILPNTEIHRMFIGKQCFTDNIGIVYGLK